MSESFPPSTPTRPESAGNLLNILDINRYPPLRVALVNFLTNSSDRQLKNLLTELKLVDRKTSQHPIYVANALNCECSEKGRLAMNLSKSNNNFDSQSQGKDSGEKISRTEHVLNFNLPLTWH